MKARILHILGDLKLSGTRTKLLSLLHNFGRDRFEHIAISVGQDQTLREKFEEVADLDLRILNLPVKDMGVLENILWTIGVLQKSRGIRPIDLVHAWNTTVHRLAIPLKAAHPKIKGFVFSMDSMDVLRPMSENTPGYRISTVATRAFANHTNSVCATISSEMRERLLTFGYKPSKIKIIRNGVDTNYFRPLTGARQDLREELGIDQGDFIIGMASRHKDDGDGYNKDVRGFVMTASCFRDATPALFERTTFVICGQGTDSGQLQNLAANLAMEKTFRILGPRTDMPRLFNAWDVSNMCSLKEPFGLVAAESMACETPCVVTETGMLPDIAGDPSLVVPIADYKARAATWEKLLEMSLETKEKLGANCRRHIQHHYSAKKMASEFEGLYSQLLIK